MSTYEVLIVDDEKELIELLIMQLGGGDFITSFANDGHEALQLIKNKDFDLIISDINMPKMDGIDLFKNVRNLKPKQKFIFMTGFGRIDKEEALNMGADAFFSKPFTTKMLIQTVHEVLDSKNSN